MPEDIYIRKNIHIFTDNPNKYSSFISNFNTIKIAYTYTEFVDDFINGNNDIYTTQACALSHRFITMGYDIFLYDNNCVIKFDEQFVKDQNLSENYYFYQMLDLYKTGNLYQND